MSTKEPTIGLDETTTRDDTPNETTAAAIAEGRRLLRDTETRGCRDMDGLRAAVGGRKANE